MCQVGCRNEDYYGDCTLHLNYCPIEFRDYMAKTMKMVSKDKHLKSSYKRKE